MAHKGLVFFFKKFVLPSSGLGKHWSGWTAGIRLSSELNREGSERAYGWLCMCPRDLGIICWSQRVRVITGSCANHPSLSRAILLRPFTQQPLMAHTPCAKTGAVTHVTREEGKPQLYWPTESRHLSLQSQLREGQLSSGGGRGGEQ